jgi:hypothetical protein
LRFLKEHNALWRCANIFKATFNQLDGFPMAISSLHMIQNLQVECIQALTTRYGIDRGLAVSEIWGRNMEKLIEKYGLK